MTKVASDKTPKVKLKSYTLNDPKKVEAAVSEAFGIVAGAVISAYGKCHCGWGVVRVETELVGAIGSRGSGAFCINNKYACEFTSDLKSAQVDPLLRAAAHDQARVQVDAKLEALKATAAKLAKLGALFGGSASNGRIQEGQAGELLRYGKDCATKDLTGCAADSASETVEAEADLVLQSGLTVGYIHIWFRIILVGEWNYYYQRAVVAHSFLSPAGGMDRSHGPFPNGCDDPGGCRAVGDVATVSVDSSASADSGADERMQEIAGIIGAMAYQLTWEGWMNSSNELFG